MRSSPFGGGRRPLQGPNTQVIFGFVPLRYGLKQTLFTFMRWGQTAMTLFLQSELPAQPA